MKIEEEIKKGGNKNSVLEHINALIVTNGDIKNKSDITEKEIEYKFGWRRVKNTKKTVDVVSYFNQNQIRHQRFFLPFWLPFGLKVRLFYRHRH